MLIQGGTLLDAQGERPGDLRIDEATGRIAQAGAALEPRAGEEVVDATGRLVIPGGIDVHTHLNRGLLADDFGSASRCGAVGGTTSVFDFALCRGTGGPMPSWEDRIAEADELSSIDYSFHLLVMGLTPIEEIAAAAERGITSIKMFMAYPGMVRSDDEVIFDTMLKAAELGMTVLVHAEHGMAIEVLRERAIAAGRTETHQLSLTRPPVLEAEAISRASALAEVAGCPLYIVHVSSEAALEAAIAARNAGRQVYMETCPSYLYLTDDRLTEPGGEHFCVVPPLRESSDVERLWRGIAQGEIFTIGTDHCGYLKEERRQGTMHRPEGFRDFTEIPVGLPGIGTRMALLYQGVANGRITAADWIRTCCENPARIFGLWPHKGNLGVGADADVVLWDPERTQSLDAQALDSNNDHSPYEGMVVQGWPDRVYLRGSLLVDDGVFVGEEGGGQLLARTTARAPARVG